MSEEKPKVDAKNFNVSVARAANNESQVVSNFAHEWLVANANPTEIIKEDGSLDAPRAKAMVDAAFDLAQLTHKRSMKYLNDALELGQDEMEARIQGSKIILPTVGQMEGHITPEEFQKLRRGAH